MCFQTVWIIYREQRAKLTLVRAARPTGLCGLYCLYYHDRPVGLGVPIVHGFFL